MRNLLPLLVLTLSTPALAEPLEPSHLVRGVGHLETGLECRDVWGSGDYAYAECGAGIIIVDVSNPKDPVQVGSWPGASDPIVYDDIMYTCTEIVDVSDPTQPVLLTTLTGFTKCHNNAFDPGTNQLYLIDEGETAVFDLTAYDASNPPGELTPALTLDPSHSGAAYAAYVYLAGGQVYDALQGHQHLGNIDVRCERDGFAHSLWPSQDSRFAVGTCEDLTEGAYLYEVEFSQSSVNSTFRDSFFLPPDVVGSAHKPRVMNRYAYVAFYEAGLQVLQIDDHTGSFRFAGNFDTSERSRSQLYGAYNVYPYLGTDRILVTDTHSGLWILEHTTLEKFAAYMSAVL